MTYKTLLEGLLKPKEFIDQLREFGDSRILRNSIIFLAAISFFIYAIGAYWGVGTETLSKELTVLLPGEFETKKLMFIIGKSLWGIAFVILHLFLPALFFWSLTDLEYKKLLVIQVLVCAILLMEKVLFFPIAARLGLDMSSSPFTLGVLGQYITDYSFVIDLLGAISLFHLWAMLIQYITLKALSEKPTKQILLIVISINLIYWIITALTSHIRIDVIF